MLLRHRRALVALLLVAIGGSLAVGVPGAHVGVDGRPAGQARFVGPDVLGNGLTLAAAPKAEGRTTARHGAKRAARSFLLAALGLVLGLLAVRRRRGADAPAALDRPQVERTRATRAPPVLVLTTT